MKGCDLILSSLDTFATREGDPAPGIYARLFAAHPELEALFLMDTDGGVRGSMLQQAFECLIDVAEGGRMAGVVLGAERVNHESYGVPDNLFDAFFLAIRDSVKASLADDWTAETSAAWTRLLARAGQASYR
ncbi:globin [Hyphomonas sp.]|uniref:globin n=1 Tax=Hyphomonas sp. TaxID=87 RepID=UPI0032EADFB1|tara:strand:- start:5704 stop:6099 length:396 start_codon:yes stop_codon:yes gene_type:complete